ncbi:transposase [bacterium]|nr:transposase [bacterium]
MPRQARIVVRNVPHHVTQRGNRRQDVFFSTKGRKKYLGWLAQYSSRYRFEILAYCLMTNHIHIVGIPRNENSMGRTLQIVNMCHTQSVNRAHGWEGHLWHSRYFSTALDESHLWLAVRYVEQNPVRAGMVMRAWDYPWSSAACHCGLRSDPLLVQNHEYSGIFEDWSDLLDEIPEKEEIEKLRNRTRTGIPCGDDKFIKKVSKISGRDYTKKTRGRPAKKEGNSQ